MRSSAGGAPSAVLRVRSTSRARPLPTKVRINAGSSSGKPSSVSVMFAAIARSGIVSSSVPSRSIVTALTRNGKLMCTAGSCDLRELRTHGGDRRPVIAALAYRRSGNERVGARACDRADVFDFDAAVHLEPYLASAAVDALAHGANLVERLGNERLTAETGIDRH